MLEPATMEAKKAAPLFMKRVLVAHTVTKAREDMSGIFILEGL